MNQVGAIPQVTVPIWLALKIGVPYNVCLAWVPTPDIARLRFRVPCVFPVACFQHHLSGQFEGRFPPNGLMSKGESQGKPVFPLNN